ncbi:MAG: cyclopropane-fatty-acyl-phospholipid synthase family protein [Planctomycetota bacterium]
MSKTLAIDNRQFLEAQNASRIERIARSQVFKRLDRIAIGCIRLVEGAESYAFGEREEHARLSATVHVKHPAFYKALAFGGSVGAGEAYMEGHWTCSDITALLRIIIRNRSVLEGVDRGLAWLTAPAKRLLHWFNRNTVTGSKRNIAAHYDLGNEFYKLFLDETMTYSSGIFETTESTLHEASIAKYDRICRKLALTREDHVMEIGTGWGGFAIHAAENYGCRVTTTTISKEQHAFARKRIEERGLSDRITLLHEDYRNVTGTYDKLVSIEMIEAVGHQYLETFLAKMSALLKPEGKAVLQAITIEDQQYKQHTRNVDFIKRYIFPGCCLLSVTALCEKATKATDLRLFHLEDITPHYATTLKKWRDRFMARLDEVRAMGFASTFIRMWEFYLCYCEAAFAEQYIGNVQAVFFKPGCREATPLAAFPEAPDRLVTEGRVS